MADPERSILEQKIFVAAEGLRRLWDPMVSIMELVQQPSANAVLLGWHCRQLGYGSVERASHERSIAEQQPVDSRLCSQEPKLAHKMPTECRMPNRGCRAL